MAIARLTDNLKLDTGDRFILLYGNVNDRFCDDDLSFGNIDLMLWRYFHAQGYQRIVFYDGSNKLFFKDDESERLCRSEQTPVSSNLSGVVTVPLPRLCQGPLGKRRLIGKATKSMGSTAALSKPIRDSSCEQSRMTDLSAIAIIDHILTNETTKISTVVVFSHAEDLTQSHITGGGFRELQNRLMVWARGGSHENNLCVFVFQQTTREEIIDLCRAHELSALVNCLSMRGTDGQNIIRINGPEQQELLNAIHYYRLTNHMEVDWPNLERIAAWAVLEGQPLSFWRSQLSRAKDFSLKSLSSMVVGDRTYSDTSAEEKLNELIGLDSVKRQIRNKLAAARQLGAAHAGDLHMVFLGNPGTGKTEVAGLGVAQK